MITAIHLQNHGPRHRLTRCFPRHWELVIDRLMLIAGERFINVHNKCYEPAISINQPVEAELNRFVLAYNYAIKRSTMINLWSSEKLIFWSKEAWSVDAMGWSWLTERFFLNGLMVAERLKTCGFDVLLQWPLQRYLLLFVCQCSDHKHPQTNHYKSSSKPFHS